MVEHVQLAQPVSIREAGLNEQWLQQQIANNPACLGLGELETLSVERQQTSGGRLDILLTNPDDDSMYEVEVMLGETDEKHIIRTIEYWDNEKRIWPQRKHNAVLVAEHINRRFFNVIHLLSYSIPIIAVQATMLIMNGEKHLYFAKILDTYEEIDDGASVVEDRAYTREDWLQKAKWTVEAADSLANITRSVFGEPALNYLKQYVALTVGSNNYMWFHPRTQPKSLLNFRMAASLQDDAGALLDAQNITYIRKPKMLRITVDRESIENNVQLFSQIAKLVKRSWEGAI